MAFRIIGTYGVWTSVAQHDCAERARAAQDVRCFVTSVPASKLNLYIWCGHRFYKIYHLRVQESYHPALAGGFCCESDRITLQMSESISHLLRVHFRRTVVYYSLTRGLLY